MLYSLLFIVLFYVCVCNLEYHARFETAEELNPYGNNLYTYEESVSFCLLHARVLAHFETEFLNSKIYNQMSGKLGENFLFIK